MASRLIDFTRMNPPTFYGSKVEEYPKKFNDETYKILYSMELTTSEKPKYAAYKLNDVAQTWHVQWRDNRPLRGGLVTLEIFKKDFRDRFFPMENMEDKVEEFINLHQKGMSALDYSLKYTKLSKYAFLWFPTLEIK